MMSRRRPLEAPGAPQNTPHPPAVPGEQHSPQARACQMLLAAS
jgi:hypothetical protein